MMRRIALLFTAALPLMAGCGGAKDVDLVAAKGKVLYQGKPVAKATVLFVPKSGPLATATTNDQGEFTLATKGRAGAVPGEHRVAVTALDVPASTPSAPVEVGSPEYLKMTQAPPPKAPKWIVPEKFSKADSSGLTQTIDADPTKNDLIVDLGS
jgi:hypothetical protein